MASLTRQIAINSLSGYFRFLVAMGVILVLTPFIISKIGTEGYGIWSLIFSILGFFELIDFGFSAAVIKYVADSKAHKDIPRRNRVISTAFLVYFTISFIGLLGVALFGLFFDTLFSIPLEFAKTATILLGMFACRSFLISLPFSVFRGILFGEQKIYLTNLISLLGSITFGILAWVVLSNGYGILTLGLMSLIASLIENLAYLFFAFYFVSDLSISWFKIDSTVFKKLISFSSTQFVSNLATIVTYNCDLIIIKLFLPLESVGIYAIPLRIVTYGYMLVKQFTNVLSPVFADMHALQKKENIQELFLRATKYSLILATLMTVAGTLFARDALVLWVGNTFANAEWVLIILLAGMWFVAMSAVSGDILQYCGYSHILALFSGIGIIVHLVVSVALIIPYGLEGVAMGALVASLTGVLTIFYKVCKIYDVGLVEFVWVLLKTLLLPSAAQIAVLLTFKTFIQIPNLWVLAAVNLLGGLAFILVLWFCLDDVERQKIKHSIPGP